MLQMRSTEAQAAAEGLKLLDGSNSLDLQLARIAHSYPDPNMNHTLQEALKSAWALE